MYGNWTFDLITKLIKQRIRDEIMVQYPDADV
jgi:hypothetical protein